MDNNNVPIKKIKFKSNTQKDLGIEVALTPEKEYEVISMRIPELHKTSPACNKSLFYIIKDDNDEINAFPSYYFYR